MAKKNVMDVDKCELCETNEASYVVRFDGEERMLCSTCKTACELGQEHPDAEIEAIGQETGIDEELFEDEGTPAKDDDQAGEED